MVPWRRAAGRGRAVTGFARRPQPVAERSAPGAGCTPSSASSRELRALAHWAVRQSEYKVLLTAVGRSTRVVGALAPDRNLEVGCARDQVLRATPRIGRL
eukprot:2218827-Prymnesium_polylepis.2